MPKPGAAECWRNESALGPEGDGAERQGGPLLQPPHRPLVQEPSTEALDVGEPSVCKEATLAQGLVVAGKGQQLVLSNCPRPPRKFLGLRDAGFCLHSRPNHLCFLRLRNT